MNGYGKDRGRESGKREEGRKGKGGGGVNGWGGEGERGRKGKGSIKKWFKIRREDERRGEEIERLHLLCLREGDVSGHSHSQEVLEAIHNGVRYRGKSGVADLKRNSCYFGHTFREPLQQVLCLDIQHLRREHRSIFIHCSRGGNGKVTISNALLLCVRAV